MSYFSKQNLENLVTKVWDTHHLCALVLNMNAHEGGAAARATISVPQSPFLTSFSGLSQEVVFFCVQFTSIPNPSSLKYEFLT